MHESLHVSLFPIERHKQPDGWYRFGGLDYENVFELLSDRIRACGCGMPDDAVKFVADMLEVLGRSTADFNGDRDAWWQDRTRIQSELMRRDGALYFVFYMLLELGFLAHGSSVPGWVTEDGQCFVAEVRKAQP